MSINGKNIASRYAALAEDLAQQGIDIDEIKERIKAQELETPSWGYGNSGTRFGVFKQPGAARDVRVGVHGQLPHLPRRAAVQARQPLTTP